jgi:hypothetical protein
MHPTKPPSTRNAPAVFFGLDTGTKSVRPTPLSQRDNRSHDMFVRMAVDAPARSTDRPRTLVCTQDGIWLWPGTPLAERRRSVISALPKSTIYDRVTKLHGPAAIYSAVVPCVDHAAALLSDGQTERAQRSLDRSRLPPVTPDGMLLMRAVERRLGIVPPGPAVRDRSSPMDRWRH